MSKDSFSGFLITNVGLTIFYCAVSIHSFIATNFIDMYAERIINVEYGRDKYHSNQHNLHVSYLKVAIEGKSGIMKASFFKDDLTLALKSFNSEYSVLEPSAALDSLFTDYIKNRLEIVITKIPVKIDIVSSGEEGDMWWYQLEFRSNVSIKEFEIMNSCLMEIYDDQKNIIQIMHFPKEKTYSYYCIAGSNRYKVILE